MIMIIVFNNNSNSVMDSMLLSSLPIIFTNHSSIFLCMCVFRFYGHFFFLIYPIECFPLYFFFIGFFCFRKTKTNLVFKNPSRSVATYPLPPSQPVKPSTENDNEDDDERQEQQQQQEGSWVKVPAASSVFPLPNLMLPISRLAYGTNTDA